MQPPKPQRKGQLAAAASPVTVGFRLDDEHRVLLGGRALKAGVSPHELARQFVVEALNDRAQLPAVQQAIVALGAQVEQLRADLALAVEALLVGAGSAKSEEASEWVRNNLSPP